MRFASLVVISGLLFAGPVSAAVYKCTDGDGRVTFAGTPCEGLAPAEQNTVEVKPTTVGGTLGVSKEQQQIWAQQRQAAPTLPAAPPRRNYCKSFSSTALRSIVVSNGMAEGMTMGAAQQSWGKPAAVNGQHPTQWVYRWRGATSYLYFVDGCVWRIDGGYGG